ncbi:MAG: radical SAM protein [Candidatus Omnitrophota bacterium]
MRILLFRQPTVYSIPVLSNATGVIATILKNAGHEVKVLDNNSIYYRVYSDRDMLKVAQEYNPDVIGFTITMLNAHRTYGTISKIRKRFPKIVTVAGGIHMKHSSGEALKHGFDIAVVREGEKVVVPLFEHLSGKGREDFREGLSSIAGVSYTREDGTVHYPTEFPSLQNFDDIPFVDYDLFNIRDYYRTGSEPLVIEICGQRGCPHRCSFCSDEVMRSDRRRMSTDYLFSYVEYLHSKYNLHYIFMNDNNFIFPRDRTVDFCNRLIRSGLNKKISFACQTKLETPIDQDFANLLKEAGFVSIGLGIERLEPHSQEMICKKSSMDRIHHVASILKKAEMNITIFMLAGFPFETVEILKKEREAFLQLTKYAKTFDLSIIMPLPGTIYYDNYPEVKEWYLNPKVLQITFSYYGQVYDIKMFGLVKLNFYKLPREINRELMKYIMTFKRINHRNFIIKRTLLVELMLFIDAFVAQISRVFFWISPSLEAMLFGKVKYLRYYYATKLFGKKLKSTLKEGEGS